MLRNVAVNILKENFDRFEIAARILLSENFNVTILVQNRRVEVIFRFFMLSYVTLEQTIIERIHQLNSI